jgi:Mn-containing catalase
VTNPELVDLLMAFVRERTALLQRHEEVAKQVTDYDVNNTYQYIVAREETHVSWLQNAILDLGAQIPAEPSRPAVAAGKGAGAWKSLAAEDSRANQDFVEKWRTKVDGITHARHKGMLKVLLGEMLEHKRFFDQAAAGRTDLLGVALAINQHSGTVIGTRWVE